MPVEGRLRITAKEGEIAAAVAGMGIVQTSRAAVRRELQDGSLVQVLEEWDLGLMELSAVFPAGRSAKRAARAFAAHVIEALRDT